MHVVDMTFEFMESVLGFALSYVYLCVPGWSVYPQEVTSILGITCFAAASASVAVLISDVITIVRGGE